MPTVEVHALLVLTQWPELCHFTLPKTISDLTRLLPSLSPIHLHPLTPLAASCPWIRIKAFSYISSTTSACLPTTMLSTMKMD